MKSITALVILLLLLFLGGCNGCEKVSAEKDESIEQIYDVVIVGGGMAGLSTGYHLKKEHGSKIKMLILEKDSRLGGRILDKEYEGIRYSLGAEFGYHEIMTPEEVKDKYKPLSQNAPRGIFYNNKLYLGKNKLDSVYSLLNEEEKLVVEKFKKGKITIYQLIEKIKKFNDFHFLIESYENVPVLKYKTDVGFSNFSLIKYYGEYLSNEVKLSSKVVSVVYGKEIVKIEYIKGGKKEQVNAESVVIATPSNVASSIIKDLPLKTETFLKSIKYFGAGVFVMIVKNRKDLIPFSYISVKGSPISLIYRKVIADGRYVSYTLYYAQDFFSENYKDLLDISVKEVNKMGFGDFEKNDIVHVDKVIWENVFSFVPPSINSMYLLKETFNPMPSVFIAGDYTMGATKSSEMLPKLINGISKNDSITKKDFIPYGVFQAWMSGLKASEDVKSYLDIKSRGKR